MKINKKIKSILKSFLLLTLFVFSAQLVSSAPINPLTIDFPINVGGVMQTKTGSLNIIPGGFSAKLGIFTDMLGINTGLTTPLKELHVVGDGGIFTSSATTTPATSPLIKGAVTFTSAINPDFTFFNDLDTGIYHITSNVLGFSTGGIERLKLSSAGVYVKSLIHTPTVGLHSRLCVTQYGVLKICSPSVPINDYVLTVVKTGANGYVMSNATQPYPAGQDITCGDGQTGGIPNTDCTETYPNGSSYTINIGAFPDAGGYPTWTGCDSVTPNHQSCTVLMNQSKTVTASFGCTDTVTYYSDGSWSLPAGCGTKAVTVKAFGGGGAGGCGQSSTITNPSGNGGGGGGSGDRQIFTQNLSTADSVSFQVGSAGQPSAPNGGNGGSTYVNLNSNHIITAVGGAGGYVPANNSSGGIGGVVWLVVLVQLVVMVLVELEDTEVIVLNFQMVVPVVPVVMIQQV
jgi:hypothetical protein